MASCPEPWSCCLRCRCLAGSLALAQGQDVVVVDEEGVFTLHLSAACALLPRVTVFSML